MPDHRQRKNRSKRRSKARKDFPKVVADYARKTGAVMVAKNMTTAHYVFDGAIGRSMVLITLDPKVVEAVELVLAAIGGNIQPADLIETPSDNPGERIHLEGGVATVALDGLIPGKSD